MSAVALPPNRRPPPARRLYPGPKVTTHPIVEVFPSLPFPSLPFPGVFVFPSVTLCDLSY
jgi:hypothetical protein